MIRALLSRVFGRQAAPTSAPRVEPTLPEQEAHDLTPAAQEMIAADLKTYLCGNKLGDFKRCLEQHTAGQPQPTYKDAQTLFHIAIGCHSHVPNLERDAYDQRGAAVLMTDDMQPFMDAMVKAGFNPRQLDENGQSPLACAKKVGKRTLAEYIENTLLPLAAQQRAPAPAAAPSA